MRVLLSTLAVIANIVVLLLIGIGVLGQAVLPAADRITGEGAIALTVVAVICALNLAAILAGARAFKPKPPTSDVVATFN